MIWATSFICYGVCEYMQVKQCKHGKMQTPQVPVYVHAMHVH